MLVTLLVVIVVIGLLVWLIQILPIAEPFRSIAIAVVLLICILWLVGYLPGGAVPWHLGRGCV